MYLSLMFGICAVWLYIRIDKNLLSCTKVVTRTYLTAWSYEKVHSFFPIQDGQVREVTRTVMKLIVDCLRKKN